ncbi:MAG: hypothetical protein ACKO4W_09995, partial [Bacteroidota bacterium]
MFFVNATIDKRFIFATGFVQNCQKSFFSVRACSGISRRVKNGSFFTFFQLRSTSYAPSKTRKLTKNL